jgi:diguanylate cyclase (GGDEF)-like protein/PAS domain S-box-containing protein
MSIHTSQSYQTSAPDPAARNGVELEGMRDVRLSAAILRASEDAIFATTLQGIVTSWNPAAERLFGYSAENMLGSFTTLPFFPDRLKERDALLDLLKQGEPIEPFYSTQLDREGKEIPVMMSLFPVRDAENEIIGIGTIARRTAGSRQITALAGQEMARPSSLSDAHAMSERLAEANAHLRDQIRLANEQSDQLAAQKAELERANRQLEELNVRLEALATTDGLTGLKNHRTFQERLLEEVRRAVRYGAPLSILMLDVDRFKTYNDAFGHPAGDAILRKIAEVIKTTARTTDVVARYGGEEFAVILPETDREQARIAAERFRAAIEATPWPEWAVTASFGVATLARTASDSVALIAQADAALYQSKRIGRNCVTHAFDSMSFPVNSESSPEGPEEPTPVMHQMMELHQDALVATASAIQTSLRRSFDSTIDSWTRLIDLRDEISEGHSVRVTDMMVRLARHLGMSKDEIAFARCGAWLHDIGKLAVPSEILFKPGPLSEEEWHLMRQHPSIAYEMLAPIPFLGPALDIPYCHHERWDGSGYPRRLKGEEIPFTARLFAVIDVFDALCSPRPFREGWTEEQARDYLQANAGIQFDPQAVHAFLKMPTG